ncbi:TRAP transporter small permease [Jonquetella anthropi]|uniref:TRAP-type C4-dicarboxylate transport system, small permease component n=1 Tax=Jonquetella anthropi DSM 22815 TaxID=885272 RepID=H0UJ43_9BACT|nr:TRAP-type C4-dicarboxylate transport system, small permease component [Jonquetella anthropi DSM 22815]
MKYVNHATKIFLATCLLFAIILLFVNVTLRYFFKSAIFWAEETLRYLIVWITFIGSSMCIREESHIAIDVLSNVLSRKGKCILKILLNVVGIIFGAILLIVSFKFIQKVYTTNQVSSTIGNMPMYVIYLCFPIGFALYTLQSLDKVRSLLKSVKKESTQS